MGDIFGKIVAFCIYISPLFLIALIVLSVYTYISNRRNAKRAPPSLNKLADHNKVYQYEVVQPYGKPSYSYNGVDVYVPEGFDVSNVCIGQPVFLVPEPENQYDNKAIAVYCNGKQLGYLYNNKLRKMCWDYVRKKQCIKAEISSLPPTLQIKLDFYKLNFESLVYISEFGKCFHSIPFCFTYDENDAIETTIKAALKKGLKPCSKCIK